MGSQDIQAGMQLQLLGQIVEARMGWSVGSGNARHVSQAIASMARFKQFDSPISCLAWLTDGEWSTEKADCCAYFLTVGETYFFRERRGFTLVVECLRERLASGSASTRPLRVWSAGCCTGEEPYSVAMAVRDAFPGVTAREVSILATDVSKRNLEAARAGVYRKWSFRGDSGNARERYFTPEGEHGMRINDDIRSLVRFGELNLALPLFPSPANGTQALDVILCRNVLMYFSLAQRRKVIERFRACLVDGGWLVVSPSEASADLFEGFVSTSFPDAIHYCKRDKIPKRQDYTPPPGPAPAVAPVIRLTLPGPARERRRAAPPPPETEPDPLPEVSADGTAAEQLEMLRAKVLRAMESGEMAAARLHLQRIIFLEPGDIAAYYLLGMVFTNMNRPALAQRKFQTAATLLSPLRDHQSVPGTDGLPAAYLRLAVHALLDKETVS